MGKMRDHFKKIRDIKRIFHTKMGTIKDRNFMDLAEAFSIMVSNSMPRPVMLKKVRLNGSMNTYKTFYN